MDSMRDADRDGPQEPLESGSLKRYVAKSVLRGLSTIEQVLPSDDQQVILYLPLAHYPGSSLDDLIEISPQYLRRIAPELPSDLRVLGGEPLFWKPGDGWLSREEGWNDDEVSLVGPIHPGRDKCDERNSHHTYSISRVLLADASSPVLLMEQDVGVILVGEDESLDDCSLPGRNVVLAESVAEKLYPSLDLPKFGDESLAEWEMVNGESFPAIERWR